ncbi:hypothetical protein PG911_01055 [Tenacibaculum ovolyticum]|nr:hypothetical protein [Tenacibaculum ovolyticum]WBX76879.1 hypothetical protein PG911_01055 [Tenacibaculum ovolyticum]
MKQIVTAFFLLIITTVFSQNLTIIDAETGKLIEGVAVYNKNKTASAISNIDGLVNASSFKSHEILVFSHVAYAEFQEKK